MKKMKQNRQVDKKTTFQIRVDKGWQEILLILRAKHNKPIKRLVEHALSSTYGIGPSGKPYFLKELDET